MSTHSLGTSSYGAEAFVASMSEPTLDEIAVKLAEAKARKEAARQALEQEELQERELHIALRRASSHEVAAVVPDISFKVDEADAVARALASAVDGFEQNTSTDTIQISADDESNSPKKSSPKKRWRAKQLDKKKELTREASTDSVNVNAPQKPSPKGLALTLKEVKKDPHISAIFRDEIIGAFKMVYLGSVDVPEHGTGSLKECSSSKLLDQMITNEVHRVMLEGQLARKVTLVCSRRQLVIVDRVHHNDVLVKHRTTELAFHGLKQIFQKGSKKVAATFLVFIAKNRLFGQTAFYCLEGKSNWSADKIVYVKNTMDSVMRKVYADSTLEEDDQHEDLTATGDVYEVPKNAFTHRIKYLGGVTVQNGNSAEVEKALLLRLATDSTDMKKHTKTKTLQHVVDFAHDAVVVVARDSIRILDAVTMEHSSQILPESILNVQQVAMENLLQESNLLQVQQEVKAKHSPSPIRRAKPKINVSSDSLKFPQLTQDQNVALQKRIDAGEISDVEAITEAQIIVNEVQDRGICIVYNDEMSGSKRCEMFVVKGSVKKAKVISMELNGVIAETKHETDPFEPTSKLQKAPVSADIGAMEIKRSDVMAVKKIGAGQFGEVYLANEYHTVASGQVSEVIRAVKTLKKGSNKKQRNEFITEAEIQLQFKHKNLVEVVGVCMMQEPYLCLLEFMPYGDLKAVLNSLNEKAITLDHHEQIYIMLQISDALKYIHDRRYVHMDLAARNVLVGNDTRVKVADFGLTRKYDDGANGYRLKGKMKLPMLWTPPECFPLIVTKGVNKPQTGNDIAFYDEKTDMWAYGVTVWEIMTYGQDPYGNGKLIATLKRIYEGERLKLPETTMKGIVNLINFAFNNDRDSRPSFAMVSEVLHNEFQRSGAAGVRDIGSLMNEGMEKRIARQSAMVGHIRRRASVARESGAAPDMVKVANEIAAMQAIQEEDEDEIDLDANSDDDGGVVVPRRSQPSTSPSVSPVARWRKLRIMLPFFQMSSWVITQNGAMQRKVKESTLDDINVHDTNPFDSEDSDTDDETNVDSIPLPVPSSGDEPQSSSSEALSSLPESGQTTVEDLSDDDESEEEEEEDENDGGGADDMDILELMAQRRAKHAEEEAKRQAEIKAAYEKQKAIDDAKRAIEIAQFEEIKRKEHEKEEEEKTRIYEEAQERMNNELTFDFSFG